MRKVDKILLCEVGPRDGLQNEITILSIDEKVKLIHSIADAGFKSIEVGSFMSPTAVPQMASTDEVFKRLEKKKDIEYSALVGNKKGVERAIACGCTRVKLNVSACVEHNLVNLNMTPEESVLRFKDSIELALAEGIKISGSISMPFGSPWQYKIPIMDVKRIIEAFIKLGINDIRLSDTSGMAIPNQVYDICTRMLDEYTEVCWTLHFHNTRGLGIANIIAAMEAGITQFDSSFGGLGGCPFVPGAAGNVVTEDILHMCEEMGIETGINLDQAIAIARYVSELVQHELPGFILKAGKNKDLLKQKN